MRSTFSAGRLLWLLPLAGLAACGSKAPLPAPPRKPVTVRLVTENHSRISGTAVLTPRGHSTEIELTLKGGRSGTAYASHVHFGTCKKPGGVVVALGMVKEGRNRTGTHTVTVLTSTLDSAATAHGSLLIQSHLKNGKPAACGEVPGRSGGPRAARRAPRGRSGRRS